MLIELFPGWSIARLGVWFFVTTSTLTELNQVCRH